MNTTIRNLEDYEGTNYSIVVDRGVFGKDLLAYRYNIVDLVEFLNRIEEYKTEDFTIELHGSFKQDELLHFAGYGAVFDFLDINVNICYNQVVNEISVHLFMKFDTFIEFIEKFESVPSLKHFFAKIGGEKDEQITV